MSELELGPEIEQLHRYHDGELVGLARWRFERLLRRSPALRRELAALERVSGAVRDEAAALIVPSGSSEGAPDLWARIAANLPAIDAQVADERARAAAIAAPDEALPAAGWFSGWRLGTAALATAAAVALVLVLRSGSTPDQGVAPIASGGGAVRFLDSGGAPVMMIDREDVTIVWMMDSV